MNKIFINIKKIIVNLLFAVKEVFSSAPLVFMAFFFVQLLNIASYYIVLFINKQIINDIVNIVVEENTSNNSISKILIWLILSTLFSLTVVFLNYVRTILTQKQNINFDKHINIKMARKCMELDISYFDNPKYYDKILRAQEGRTRLGFVVYRVIFFISNIISFIIAFSLSLSSNTKYTFLIIVLTLPVFFTKGMYYRKKYIYENDTQKIKRKISYLANIILGKDAAKEIRFYNIENLVVKRYKENWNKYALGLKRIINKQGFFDSLLITIPIVGIMLAMYDVVINITQGQNQIGDFSYYLGIYTSLSTSLFNLIEDLAKMGESELAIKNYNEFISAKPLISYEGNIKLDCIKSIRFDNVSFCYPQSKTMVLNKVSFELFPNKKNAIVGVNGSGKTTLIKLLLRFYDVDSGEILINNINIKEYDIKTLRENFSAVFQDYVIYSLSIRDNIAFSNYSEKHNDLKIYEALEFADIKKEIIDRTNSLDTFLSRDFSDNGIELSGGQKQKIAIAKSAFSSAQILILDEATSSLDARSEQNIFSKFEELYREKGIIFISHRLSNMQVMDNIIVLKNGKLIEEGKHRDLLKLKGEYFKLFTSQAKKYVLGEESNEYI